jgi:nicotinamide phosphoribosyltransferase
MKPKMKDNTVFLLDSYKIAHPKMLPEGTTGAFSYGESRKGARYPYTALFGLRYILQTHLAGPRVTPEKIAQANELLTEHFKFCGDVYDARIWEYILREYNGRLPLTIRAVREGTKVPTANMMVSVETSDKNCAWLVGGVETVLQQMWYPSTVATRSRCIIDIIKAYFKRTVDDDLQWLADYYLHDFGQRAATCMEAAGLGGMSHLLNSKGTDTLMGMAYAIDEYDASPKDLAYSVPASEHLIATSLGKAGEFAVAKRLLQLFPKGILSHVSDSYNITEAIRMYNEDPEFRRLILARDGKFVARPDSPRFEQDTPQDQILWITQQWDKGYGHRVNTKGYKDLDPHVGTIYGDSLTEDNIEDTLSLLEQNGYSALASVFGCGGYLIQRMHRDTQRQAFKCSALMHDGEWRDICKEPLDKTKVSKKGRLKLIKNEYGDFETVPFEVDKPDQMVTVFKNGNMMNVENFAQIRRRINGEIE